MSYEREITGNVNLKQPTEKSMHKISLQVLFFLFRLFYFCLATVSVHVVLCGQCCLLFVVVMDIVL